MNEHRAHINDQPIGGYPPGSIEARDAISRVGRALHGKSWKPGRHLGKEEHQWHCFDCGVETESRHLRCVPCNKRNQAKMVKASMAKKRDADALKAA